MGSPRLLAKSTTWCHQHSKVSSVGSPRARSILTLRSDPDDDLPNNHRLSNLEHRPEIDGRWSIPTFLWIFDRFSRIILQPPITPTPAD